jgi:hypothetical protein
VQQSGLFHAPPTRSVGRSLLVACLWSLGLVFLDALALAVVALVVFGIATISQTGGGGTVLYAVVIAAWVVWIGSGIVLIWVAAYASTGWGSRGRTVLGVLLGLALGIGYTLLGAPLGVVVGLAAGWAVVIPAEKVGRIFARSLPALLIGLMSLPDLPGPATVGLVAFSPWIAALLVLVGDVAWNVLARLGAEE